LGEEEEPDEESEDEEEEELEEDEEESLGRRRRVFFPSFLGIGLSSLSFPWPDSISPSSRGLLFLFLFSSESFPPSDVTFGETTSLSRCSLSEWDAVVVLFDLELDDEEDRFDALSGDLSFPLLSLMASRSTLSPLDLVSFFCEVPIFPEPLASGNNGMGYETTVMGVSVAVVVVLASP
jgi:hypothetical protein